MSLSNKQFYNWPLFPSPLKTTSLPLDNAIANQLFSRSMYSINIDTKTISTRMCLRYIYKYIFIYISYFLQQFHIYHYIIQGGKTKEKQKKREKDEHTIMDSCMKKRKKSTQAPFSISKLGKTILIQEACGSEGWRSFCT